MKYFKCELCFVFTINCSLVNFVFPYDFFSKIVRTKHDTITTVLLYHYNLSYDTSYSWVS